MTGWNFSDGNSAAGTQNQGGPAGGDGSYWAFLNLDSAGQTGTITTSASPTIIQPNVTYYLTVALETTLNRLPTVSRATIQSAFCRQNISIATTTVLHGTIPNNSFEDFTVSYHAVPTVSSTRTSARR